MSDLDQEMDKTRTIPLREQLWLRTLYFTRNWKAHLVLIIWALANLYIGNYSHPSDWPVDVAVTEKLKTFAGLFLLIAFIIYLRLPVFSSEEDVGKPAGLGPIIIVLFTVWTVLAILVALLKYGVLN